MSRDSSPTYIHLRASRHADLFEEFCRPPSSSNNPNSQSNPSNPRDSINANPNGTNDNSGMIQIPGSFLPYEEIHLPSHLMPVNPEDEDDVVPDMHAAFGIEQALGRNGEANGGQGTGVRVEERWRDLGMERLLDGGLGGREVNSGTRLGDLSSGGTASAVNGSGRGTGVRREGRRTGLLLMR